MKVKPTPPPPPPPFLPQKDPAAAEGAAARFACVVDPWHRELKVALTPDGPDQATITVTGTGFADTLKWTAAKGQFEAATWHGSRPGGFYVTVDSKTAVPPAQ